MRAHWKPIAVLIVLVLLAVFALRPGPATPTPEARLRVHAEALATRAQGPAGLEAAARYVTTTLAADGYHVERQHYSADGRIVRKIEAWRPAPRHARRATRTFILGARYDAVDEDERTGTAAMLELARLLKSMRPAPGTEIRFVFLLGRRRPGDGPAAAFVAWTGPRAASGPVGQALASFRNAPDVPAGPFATPAWVQGVTIGIPQPTNAASERAMLIADTSFAQYPCQPAIQQSGQPDYESVAHVVRQLAHSVTVLASLAKS
jgi:hypothetical protein